MSRCSTGSESAWRRSGGRRAACESVNARGFGSAHARDESGKEHASQEEADQMWDSLYPGARDRVGMGQGPVDAPCVWLQVGSTVKTATVTGETRGLEGRAVAEGSLLLRLAQHTDMSVGR